MSDDLNADMAGMEELLRRYKKIDVEIRTELYRLIDFQLARNERLEKALQEIAGSKLFNSHDPADCTEEVFGAGRALIQKARDAVRRDNA